MTWQAGDPFQIPWQEHPQIDPRKLPHSPCTRQVLTRITTFHSFPALLPRILTIKIDTPPLIRLLSGHEHSNSPSKTMPSTMPGTSRGKKSFSSSLSSSSSFSSSSSSSCVSLQIKEDDRFFSKLLSRESSSSLDRANNLLSSSSRALYYGGSQGSVPFIWESRPGTPKNPTVFPNVDTYPAANIVPELIPPLTPPPNAYFSSLSSSLSSAPGSPGKRFIRRNKQQSLSLSGMVSRVKSSGGVPRTRSHTLSLSSTASPSPWTWSGSGSASVSHSSASTTSSCSSWEQRHPSRSRLHPSFLPEVDVHSKTDRTHRSPDSTLNFGQRRKQLSSAKKFWVCGPVAKVKRVLLSIVGHRSSSHPRAARWTPPRPNHHDRVIGTQLMFRSSILSSPVDSPACRALDSLADFRSFGSKPVCLSMSSPCFCRSILVIAFRIYNKANILTHVAADVKNSLHEPNPPFFSFLFVGNICLIITVISGTW